VSADPLLLQITNCPVVTECRRGSRVACSRVVGFQSDTDWSDYHVPEPWNGELESARLLFVSSNPAIDSRERYPTPGWTDAERIDFFRRRFSGGRQAWTYKFRTLLKDGSYDAAPRAGKYWAEIHQRAIELIGPDAKAGIDYALTEVVYCKSGGNHGVKEARNECASRYLEPLLEAASEASVIVLVGKQAWAAFSDRYGSPPCFGVTKGMAIAGRDRMVVSIGAPNSSQQRKLTRCLSTDQLAYARRLLAGGLGT
jgi:uracil-DNA glycosylase